MTGLVIESASPLMSVQDAGRFGAQRYGLGPSGAMDRHALAAANALVGQPLHAAAIEIGALPARVRAQEGGVWIALAGAERAFGVGAVRFAINRSLWLAEGEVLSIGPARDGMFTYLAAAGGIVGAPVFGSLSVHARAGLGSPYARPLMAGDVIELGPPRRTFDTPHQLDLPAQADAPLRVVLGPQDDYFTDKTIAAFLDTAWLVSAKSDRMGYRLEGPVLAHARGANIVSDGTVTGSIQIPGNGQPLVLMPDRGTTGGYPKIATIITADLGRFAQTPPGRAVRFAAIGVTEAQAAARADAADRAALPQRCVAAGLSLEALFAGNLAGQAVNALDTDTWQDVTARHPEHRKDE